MSRIIFYGFLFAVTWGCNCSLPSSHWNPTTIQPSWSAQLRHIICCNIHWTHNMISQQVWTNRLMFHESSTFFSTSVHHRSSSYIDQELNKPLTERRPHWGLTRRWLSWSQRIPSDLLQTYTASRIKESSRIKQIYTVLMLCIKSEKDIHLSPTLGAWESKVQRVHHNESWICLELKNLKPIEMPFPDSSDSRLADLSCPTTWPRCFDPWNLGVKYNGTVLPQCFGCFRFFSHCDFQIFSVLSLLLIYCIVHMWPEICNAAACLCHDIMHKVTLPSCIKKQSNRCLFLRQWWCQTMATVSEMFHYRRMLCLWPSFDLINLINLIKAWLERSVSMPSASKRVVTLRRKWSCAELFGLR